MRDRQFQRLRQEYRDAVAAHEPVRPQHIGEAARHLGDLIERRAGHVARLVEIDQREFARAVGMTVAAGGRDIEARRDIPAEVAVELVVTGGFGEHGPWSRPLVFFVIAGHSRSENGVASLAYARPSTFLLPA